MRSLVFAAAGAALAITVWSGTDRAFAFTTVVGGLAGQCFSAAKKGLHDRRSLDICSQALTQTPLSTHDLAGTYVNRAAMKLLNKDWEQAHQDFNEALRIKPDMGEAHVGEGVYLISMERWAEAEAEINRGINLGSEEPEKGYYYRGLARWGQENFKGAYLDFHKALELKPDWDLPKQQLSHFKVTPAD